MNGAYVVTIVADDADLLQAAMRSVTIDVETNVIGSGTNYDPRYGFGYSLMKVAAE